MVRQRYPEFDPLLEMAKIATSEDTDAQLKFNALKEITKYFYPQLKAVEHSGEGGGPLRATVTMRFESSRAPESDG